MINDQLTLYERKKHQSTVMFLCTGDDKKMVKEKIYCTYTWLLTDFEINRICHCTTWPKLSGQHYNHM